MIHDVLDELGIEPDEPALEIEIGPGTVIDIPAAQADLAQVALMEVLPADFKLPALIKFIPNPALRADADQTAVYALSIAVDGADGLQLADAALAVLRTKLKAINDHLEEPIGIAYGLHKRLTSVRSEWQAQGDAAVKTVGNRIYTEQKRLDGLAAEQRRRDQAEADRKARADAQREAEAAERAQAPAPVVQELKRQAATVTAPPVVATAAAPALRSSTTVTAWKARIAETPGSDEPNPAIEALSPAQRLKVFDLLKAILDGKAPLAAIELSWSYLNKRAKADKGTLAIAGVEAFEEGSVRAKGSRSK